MPTKVNRPVRDLEISRIQLDCSSSLHTQHFNIVLFNVMYFVRLFRFIVTFTVNKDD